MMIDRFGRYLRRGPGVTSTAQVWALWCIENGCDPKAEDCNGVHRNYLVRWMRKFNRDLPPAKPLKQQGVLVRGWHGWILCSAFPREPRR